MIDAMSRLLPCAFVAVVAGCVTPSIPVPPPDPQAMSFALDATASTASFTYAPADHRFAGAVVFVFDRNAGHGVIDTARADGSVGPTMPFPATAGDDIAVT